MKRRGIARTRAAGTLTGLVAIVLGLLPALALGAYPGANGRIAFAGRTTSTSPFYHIFTVLPGGSGLKQLTQPVTNELEPSWSADGQRIAYIRGAPQASGYQVFKMGKNGAGQRRVTHDNGIDGSPGFSPDGRRIVYSKDNLPTADADNPRRVSIFKIRTDGTHKRLIVHGGYAASPEYSPNGKRIAFEGSPNRHRPDGIWTIRPDGTDPRRLTNPGKSQSYDEYPDWAPDGRHIAFLRCDIDSTHGCDGHVFLMRADGSHEHSIRRIFGEVPPAYAPEGDRIALSTAREECTDLYTISITGSNPQFVTQNCDNLPQEEFAVQPSWQPIP